MSTSHAHHSRMPWTPTLPQISESENERPSMAENAPPSMAENAPLSMTERIAHRLRARGHAVTMEHVIRQGVEMRRALIALDAFRYDLLRLRHALTKREWERQAREEEQIEIVAPSEEPL